MFSLAQQQHIVFVIDEFPYLAQSDRSVSSLLQHLIDRNKESSRLFLILCGSSLSFMEHQVLGHKSPLYGRRTAQIKVHPFDIMQAAQLLPDGSPEDIVTWYGIAGGIPLYLEQLDPTLSLTENLAANVLQPDCFLFGEPDCFLFGEPDSFLQQEVREPARYNAIIRAIANGEERLTDIADAAGIERREQAEIDVVALCDDGSMVCGECKWQAKQTDTDVLRTLQHRASLIGKADEQRLFLFSKSGFTDACRSEAASCGCRLVTLADMGLGR